MNSNRQSGETRKIQVAGGTTFTVSLPKGWADAMELQAGDEVVLEPRADGTLVVRPGPRARAPAVRAAIEDPRDPEALLRSIIGLYTAGADVIEVLTPSGASDDVVRVVEEACDRLLGVQVVDQGARSTTMQDLADPRELDLRQGFRRMHLIVHRMLKEVQRLMGEGDEAAHTARDEAELDRLLLLVVKHHRRRLLRPGPGDRDLTPLASFDHVMAAHYLERIGDYAERIAGASGLATRIRGTEMADHTAGACAVARECVDGAVEAFAAADADRANATIRNIDSFRHLVRTLPLEDIMSGTQPAFFPHCDLCLTYGQVYEHLERIGLYGQSIAEVAINRSAAERDQEAIRP